MSYLKFKDLKYMIEKEFGYKDLVIEEIQIDGKFYKVNDTFRIHYQENYQIRFLGKSNKIEKERMKKDNKKELRKLNDSELDNQLNELQKQKIALENDVFKGTKRNYPMKAQSKPYGNLKNIKKCIAVIKTIQGERN